MQWLAVIPIVDVFIWSVAVFLLVLLGFAIYSVLNRPSKQDVLHGLPKE